MKEKYSFFTTREIKPQGWLKRQLEIEADGLAGNLDKVWRDVRDSMWVGGDSDSWERVPYWLDGFIPLAYLLDDADRKARAQKYIDKIIDSQREDGWLCPCSEEQRGGYDMWALILLAKVLVVYHDCTGDERVESVLLKAMRQFNTHLDEHPLFGWGHSRWFECLIPLYWLYERTGEAFLLELAYKMHAQGLDWEAEFRNWTHADARCDWTQQTHVVNQSMMLKAGALYAQISGESPSAFADDAWKKLMDAHGACYGMFTGDECLAGRSPVQGTELCAVVEAMYSFEWLYALTGDDTWMDRLEYVAFNALPAAISPDMWTHQYDQMANQVQCSVFPEGKTPFLTNSAEANLFGLEPHFGCCTANFGQGYPKLALSAFMKSKTGIVSAALVPASVSTAINRVPVTVTLETAFPFRETLRYIVCADADVTFTLGIRIPAYVQSATVDNAAVPCGLYEMTRTWRKGETIVEVSFTSQPELIPAYEGMVYLRKGALLYTVALDENWTKSEYTRNGVARKFPYCDYEIRTSSPWNYAFAGERFTFEERPFTIDQLIYSPANAPILATAEMYRIKWVFEDGKCATLPDGERLSDVPEKVHFLPYGCTSLHMTVMPKQ